MYRIKVFDEDGGLYRIYNIVAKTPEDARAIAFILDGGCCKVEDGVPKMVSYWDQGHIELAKTYTEVIP